MAANTNMTDDDYLDALWDIWKLTGADTDGDWNWSAHVTEMGAAGFTDMVVEAVREFRQDHIDGTREQEETIGRLRDEIQDLENRISFDYEPIRRD